MKILRTCAAVLLSAWSLVATAQSWEPLANQPSFNASIAFLLTDGTLMVHDIGSNQGGTNNWWRLTPDNTGSYVKGTWSQLASMSSSYGPLYYASAVLPDGRVLVEGGEYNFGAPAETSLGAIYDPLKNKWTSVNPPSGWSSIGDSPGIVLANGTFMMGQNFSTNQVLFNAKTLKWTATGSGKQDIFAEEGFNLLPDQTVLLVDTENGTHAEKYIPSTGQWVSAGSTIVQLPANNGHPIVPELGPIIERPDGTAYAIGATSNTAVYHPPSVPKLPGKWTVGPKIPGGLSEFDGPAALLPTGNVLMMTSLDFYQKTGDTKFFEFNGTKLNPVPDIPGSANTWSFVGDMLVLPTGQILLTQQTMDIEVYTPKGTVNAAWSPTITAVPKTIARGNSYLIKGTQFNGLSLGATYGDDGQMATNYPLVRITNDASKHVFYARTHGHSTMAIATGKKPVSTNFDVPMNMETGASELAVIANGIASKPVAVTVQ